MGLAKEQEGRGEDGFALIGLVVAIFLILLLLGVAAPRVAQELRREREVEAVHRANQYVRAVRLFYLKNGGRYPGSIEQLEKTSNVRFLRQKYVDPMTGKADWRVIHVGEAKTTVKGFFGQPLTGLAPGLGSAASLASGGAIGAAAVGSPSGFGIGATSTSGPGAGSAGSAGANIGTGGSVGPALGSAGASTGDPGSTSSSSSPGVSSQSAADFKGGGAPFVGIGSAAGGNSILELNEQTTYNTWEFLYDPRVEQMKAKVKLTGGGVTSTNASDLGSASGNVSPVQGSTPPGTTPSGSTPPGSSTPGSSTPGSGTPGSVNTPR